jgi:hypothetical protein
VEADMRNPGKAGVTCVDKANVHRAPRRRRDCARRDRRALSRSVAKLRTAGSGPATVVREDRNAERSRGIRSSPLRSVSDSRAARRHRLHCDRHRARRDARSNAVVGRGVRKRAHRRCRLQSPLPRDLALSSALILRSHSQRARSMRPRDRCSEGASPSHLPGE